jgi:hypothetical protein
VTCGEPRSRPAGGDAAAASRVVAMAILSLGLGLGATAGGCKKDATYLEVRFTGSGLPEIRAIRVTLRLPETEMDGAALHAIGTVARDDNRPITFPSSATFKLDDERGPVQIFAEALAMRNGEVVATGRANTSVMHNESWRVDVPLGVDGALQGDAGTGNDDDGGFAILDGSITGAACATVRVAAAETVSLDYNTSGMADSPGPMLVAANDAERDYVGWMKFNLRRMMMTLPADRRITEAILELTLMETVGATPTLVVQYSGYDSWLRSNAAVDRLTATHAISDPMTGVPSVGVNRYTLYADPQRHDWASDAADGFVTLGIDSANVAGDRPSNSRFFGMGLTVQANAQPALYLTVCPL